MSLYTFAIIQNTIVLSSAASVMIFADGLWKIGGLVMLGFFTSITTKGNN